MVRRATRLLVFVLFLTAVSLTAQEVMAAAFPDISDCSCASSVAKLQYVGCISGYADGTFQPGKPISRGELTRIVTGCMGIYTPGSVALPSFADVPPDHWAFAYVEAAVRAGVARGYPDGTFRPGGATTYYEVLAMLLRACGAISQPVAWPDGYVVSAQNVGLCEGFQFDGNAEALRGVAVIWVERAVFQVVNPNTGRTLGQGLGIAREAEIHFVDVGQGDATIVVTPAGNALLIDAGPAAAANKLVAFIASLTLPDIDAVVLTHPHADHIGGMSAVLAAFSIGVVYDTQYSYDSSTYSSVKGAIVSRGVTTITARAGVTVPLDPWVDVQIIHPLREYSSCNDNSIVLKVDVGSFSLLVMGDAEVRAEGDIVKSNADRLSSDVLRIGHHGSSTSTGQGFLNLVAPYAAIISVGTGNTYGHPAATTLYRLRGAGVVVYRTDLHGTISIRTDGQSYTITSQSNR